MYVDPTGFILGYAEWKEENPGNGVIWSNILYIMYYADEIVAECWNRFKTWGEEYWTQIQMAFGSSQAYAAASPTPDMPLPRGTKAGQGKDWDPYSKRKDASRRKYPYPENPTDVWDYYPGEEWVEDADLFKNEITSSLSSDSSKKESLYDFFRNVVGPGLVVVSLFKINPVLKVLSFTVGVNLASMPTKEEHYNRNQYNMEFPPTLEKWIEDEMISGVPSNCHYFSAPNKDHQKFVARDGGSEVIYTVKGDRVDDPRDIGTFNFAHPDCDPMGHFFMDVVPWLFWGNSPEDTTTDEERLKAFIGR